ncbi:5-formyltetrahydrofolate cyclo-ligase [Chthonobacter albigriseus]|uniref:5-formyltetrahydrofolate cyclo-ligase n=1 Tax=Chthonobacter albigriseus TaxID=1683161 RepID=UPI001FCF0637|nr:5-formyltetrahydrofolate cyclo-ligase [Chthonobacter albigriseus]
MLQIQSLPSGGPLSALAPDAIARPEPPALPTDLAAQKSALRNASLARRDALDPDDRARWSADIADRILALDIPAGAPVSAFLPIRSEVDLRPAAERLVARGHAVGLPIIRKPDLVFRAFDPASPLVPLGFGTYGPGPECPEVVPEVMLVPLSVFDRRGGRIGYGKAYYDITIAGFRAAGYDPRLIGVAFSVQEADAVPMEPHDVPLHAIVTERDLIIPAAS